MCIELPRVSDVNIMSSLSSYNIEIFLVTSVASRHFKQGVGRSLFLSDIKSF